MYTEFLTQLLTPILFEKINEVEIRELRENNHYELIVMSSLALLPILNGKKNSTKKIITTILESKAYLNNNTISLVISEL